jgi:hypothetical protein
VTLTICRRPPEQGRRREPCLSLIHRLPLAVLALAIGSMAMTRLAEAKSEDGNGNPGRIVVAGPLSPGKSSKAPGSVKIGQMLSDKTKKKPGTSGEDDCDQNSDSCGDAHPSGSPFAEDSYCDQFPKSHQCYCEANPDAKRCKGQQ